MHALKFADRLLAVVAITALLAGCASTPAPVTNYSFGANGQPAASTAPATSAPATSAARGGAKTFGLGGHARGTVGAGGYTVAAGDTMYSVAFAHGMDVRDLAALNGISPPYVIHPGQVLKLKPGTPAAPTAAPVVATAPPPAPATPTVVSPTPPAQPSAPVFGAVTTQTMTANGVAPASAASVAEAPVASAATAAASSGAPSTAIASAPVVAAAPAPQAATPTPPAGATRSVAGITWQWPATGKVLSGFQPGSGGEGAGVNVAGNLGDPVRAAASGTVVYSGDGLIGYGELIIIKHNDTYLSAYGHNSKRLVKEGDRVGAGQEIALMGASGASRVELHFEIRKDGKPVDPLGYLPGR